MLTIIYCIALIPMAIGGSVINDFASRSHPKMLLSKGEVNDVVRSTLDCTKFRRDYDVLNSLPFYPVEINPPVKIGKTFAIMDNNNVVTELTIHKERFVPMNIYCLKGLTALLINNTRFHEFPIENPSSRGLPAEIGQLTLLQRLHIYDSPVEYLPKEIANLTRLNNLIIENGYLIELTNVIDKLSTLQYMTLSKNKLKALPSSIGSLRSLQTLVLDNNELTSLPSNISTLTVLRTLDLRSNPLTSIDELNNMPNLNYLYAQNCKIAHLPMNIPRLITLDMSNNNLPDLLDIGTLGNLYSGWKSFDFSYNRITIIPPAISRTTTYMQKFSVKGNKLTYLPTEFYTFSNSASNQIDLSENQFSDEMLNEIKNTMRTRLSAVKVVY